MNILSETVSTSELSKLSKEQYDYAKLIAQKEYKRMTGSKTVSTWYSTNIDLPLVNRANRSKEVAFVNSKYSNEDYIIKCVIASNVAFNSDESFVSILINSGYTLGNLVVLTKYFEKLNTLITNLEDLNLDKMEMASKELKHIQRICRIMKKYFNVDDYQLVANKITEIVVFEQDMFLEKEKELKKRK